MKTYSVRHECYQNRAGISETFFEHSMIRARDDREAVKIAKRIGLDSRRRKLVKVTEIGAAQGVPRRC